MEPAYYTVDSIDGDYAHMTSDSGLRQGELASLPWAAVDVCGQRVVIAETYVVVKSRRK